MAALQRCYNVEDFRRRARGKLPSPLFHYIDGGADDEHTLRANTAAFEQYQLVPRILQDARHKLILLEGRRVRAQSVLIVGAAVDVMEQRRGQFAARTAAEILDVVTALQRGHGTPGEI